MRIPRRITDIVNRKQAFIDSQRDKLIGGVARLQERLLNAIIAELIANLDVSGGIVLDNEHNYRLLSTLDSIYEKFRRLTASEVLKQTKETFDNIRARDYDFLSVTLGGDLPERFAEIVKDVIRMTNFRFGLDGGKFVRGGFLESIIGEMNPLALKRHLAKLVTTQVNTKEFIKALQYYFQGNEGFQKKFERFAFDIYQQYDATYNSKLAEKFDLKYFIYQGGLIADSRDFCAAHDTKVWTTGEAQQWERWRPIDGITQGQYPEGYEVKQKDLYAVPSYLGYPGYDPLIDRGGYNCRHQLSFISNELAERLRPDLKEKKSEKT